MAIRWFLGAGVCGKLRALGVGDCGDNGDCGGAEVSEHSDYSGHPFDCEVYWDPPKRWDTEPQEVTSEVFDWIFEEWGDDYDE